MATLLSKLKFKRGAESTKPSSLLYGEPLLTDDGSGNYKTYIGKKDGSLLQTFDSQAILTGTNTGDETTASIKTKLGITTLSGSNTGDQDLSGLVPKTTAVNSKALSSNVTLTTADIADSTNKRYVTDANLTTIGNQSGTNTGDETITTIKSKLGITTLSGSNTGDQDLSGLMVKANNLSDVASASTARTNLGLGTLATQSGTFSGTSSGTNTGDETTSSIQTKLGTASTSTSGYLTSTDWNTFNGKQDALVSGTNIKTINGSSVLGSGNLTITGTGGGATQLSDLTDILISSPTTGEILQYNSGSSAWQNSPLTIGSDSVIEQSNLFYSDGRVLSAIQNVVAHVFNVKAYGALGDNSTDDTTSIQNAIDACNSAGGGTVFFPQGIYLVSSNLTVYSFVRLVGEGRNASEIRSSAYGSGASITGNSVIYGVDLQGVEIEHLSIRGAGKIGASGSVINFDTSISSNKQIVIRNCRLYESAWETVKIKQLLFSTIENTVIESSASDGLYLYGGGTSVTVRNCYAGGITQAAWHPQLLYYSTFSGCASDSNGIGYFEDACTDVTFISCGAESAYDNSSTYSGIHFKLYNGTGNSFISCYGNNFVSGGSHTSKSHINISGETNSVIEAFRGISTNTTGFVLPDNSYVIDSASSVKFISPYFQNGSAGGTGSPLFDKDAGSFVLKNPSGSMNLLIAGTGGGNGTLSLSRDGTGNYGLMGFQTNLVDKWSIGMLPTTGDDFSFGNSYAGGTPIYLKLSNNNVGINTTSPTAGLHLRAGNATANTGAPLKFTSGTLLSVVEDGAAEYDGTHYYLSVGSTRYQIDRARIVSSISVNTAAGAVTLADYVYLVSGTTTLTLPTAVNNTSKYTVKNAGTNTVTIATTSSQTIDGSIGITLPVANSSVDLISNGSNWVII